MSKSSNTPSTPTVTELPSDTAPIEAIPAPCDNVTELFANSAFATPLSLIVTAPLDTLKLSELNDATPLLLVVASSPLNVTVPELSATSNPSPAAKVIVPPSEIAVVFEPSLNVIELFESFPLAIEPANISLVTPPSAIPKFSEPASSKPAPAKSLTSISSVTELPSDTLPPVFNPSPAVIVTALFESFELAIEPASSSFDTPLSFIVTAPLDTLKLSELKEAIPLFDVVASSPAIVTVSELTLVSIPSPPAIVSVSVVVSATAVPLSEATFLNTNWSPVFVPLVF